MSPELILQDLTAADSTVLVPGGSAFDAGTCQPLSGHMTRRDRMIEKLTGAFAPARLEVTDESRLHAGHAGHRPGGETHYRVYIVSEVFKGKSRLDRHRMVNDALADELVGGVHALAIQARAPGEG